MEEKQSLVVELRPEMAEAFEKCISFSSILNISLYYYLAHHGRAAFLLKDSSKRKRTKSEMEEVKQEEEELKNDK